MTTYEVDGVKFYTTLEERLNIGSHALGIALSVLGLILLVVRASLYGSAWHVVSVSVFGISMVALYTASTVYHSAREPRRRSRLRIVDHAAIYLLISGTYTPFTLLVLQGTIGWVIFGVSWGMALTGIVLKLFFTGRFKLVSTLMYVFMGWLIVFAIEPLVANLDPSGLAWLVAGGIAYTLGAVLYSIRAIRFNHAIFHLFVLLGSICHFVAVYAYLLPSR